MYEYNKYNNAGNTQPIPAKRNARKQIKQQENRTNENLYGAN